MFNEFYHYREIMFKTVENVRISLPAPFSALYNEEEKNFQFWSKHNLLVGPVLVRLSQTLEKRHDGFATAFTQG